MFNLDNITNENNKKHNEKWPNIPDHPYKMLIIGGSGSGKTNALLNLIKQQLDIDKTYLYAKDLNDSNAFTECSELNVLNTMDDVYENIDEHSPSRKRKILIVFDDIIADIVTNKIFQATSKELFIRCRKLNISLVFITQSYFSIPKDIRLNSTHYLIMKIYNKRELQNIAINHSADIDYKDFMKVYIECTKNRILF